MYGYIYLTVNLVNNKKYVGMHRSESFDPNYKGSGIYLWNAIRKYGIENFETTLLKECYSEEELVSAEIQEISQRDAVNSSEYYNLMEGGHGSFSYINSHRSELDMNHADMSGEKNPNYGHRGYHLSEETRRRMSEVRKGKSPSPEAVRKSAESRRGIHLSPERRQAISASRTECVWVHCYISGVLTRTTVSPEELESYLEQGYMKGYGPRTKSSTKGRVRLIRDNVIKYCLPEDLETYLNEGWVRYTGKAVKLSSTTIESIGNEKDITE